jgi:signal peptidase I
MGAQGFYGNRRASLKSLRKTTKTVGKTERRSPMTSKLFSPLAEAWAQVRTKLAPLVPAPVKAFFARKDVQAAWEWIKEPLYAVLLMFALTTVLVQPFYVPSGSMEPSLAIGDAVLASKFSYGYTRYSMPFDYFLLGHAQTTPKPVLSRLPKVGDVVVFRLPRDTTVTFVKRVIGLPGDRIQMKDGKLWINGKELPLRPAGMADDEDEGGNYQPVPVFIETLPNGKEHRIFKRMWDGPADNTGVYTVPPGNVFMMGDNRDNSLDSRFDADGRILGTDYVNEPGVGYVPVANLVGKAFIVIGSVDFKNADNILEWPMQFRFSRVLNRVR